MEKSQFNSIYKDEYKKSTGLLFIRAYHKWHGLTKNKLRTIDLTHPQFVVLTTLAALLRQQEWVSQTHIAQFSDMDVMTVSQIIRLLVKERIDNAGSPSQGQPRQHHTSNGYGAAKGQPSPPSSRRH